MTDAQRRRCLKGQFYCPPLRPRCGRAFQKVSLNKFYNRTFFKMSFKKYFFKRYQIKFLSPILFINSLLFLFIISLLFISFTLFTSFIVYLSLKSYFLFYIQLWAHAYAKYYYYEISIYCIFKKINI